MAEDGTDTSDTDTDDDLDDDTGTDASKGKGDPPDPAADAEKWKTQSRKWEDRAKANASAAKELAALKASTMTDQEKAVEAAKAEARSEALKTVGVRLVDAEVKAACAGRKVDVSALLEGLDRTKFLTDDGEPDSDAIAKWVDKVAPSKAGPLDLGQGARGRNGSGGSDMNTLIRDRMRR